MDQSGPYQSADLYAYNIFIQEHLHFKNFRESFRFRFTFI